MPKTLTHFYQESGRAGRDGLDSKCIVFFAYRDKARLEVCTEMTRHHTKYILRIYTFQVA